MSFLTKAELKTVKASDVINIIDQEDPNGIVDDLIKDNIDRVKNYLRNFYDADAVFAATDDDRNRSVLRTLKHLVVADIFTIRNQQWPQVIEKLHDEAMRWLEQVNAGQINIDLPLKQVDSDGDGAVDSDITVFRSGGNTKYGNHW